LEILRKAYKAKTQKKRFGLMIIVIRKILPLAPTISTEYKGACTRRINISTERETADSNEFLSKSRRARYDITPLK
jgi:hypothetical protein